MIDRLVADGVDVRGATWAAIYDDDQPYLYLITADVEDRDSRPTYKKVAAARIALAGEGLPPEQRIDREAVKLIPPSSPLARSVLSIYHRYPDDRPTVHHESGLGSGNITGAYIYPASLFRPQPAPEPAAAEPPAGV
ncbi:MAG: hypothetical protein K2X87_00570 [Gemmataceae bacterium]|nr:hypothetical protein [Gemmataceae bacterium]